MRPRLALTDKHPLDRNRRILAPPRPIGQPHLRIRNEHGLGDRIGGYDVVGAREPARVGT